MYSKITPLSFKPFVFPRFYTMFSRFCPSIIVRTFLPPFFVSIGYVVYSAFPFLPLKPYLWVCLLLAAAPLLICFMPLYCFVLYLFSFSLLSFSLSLYIFLVFQTPSFSLLSLSYVCLPLPLVAAPLFIWCLFAQCSSLFGFFFFFRLLLSLPL